jgi:hypothetical protein
MSCLSARGVNALNQQVWQEAADQTSLRCTARAPEGRSELTASDDPRKWTRIAGDLRDQMDAGELKPDARVSIAQESRARGASRTTVAMALKALAAEGRLKRFPGHGCVVVGRCPSCERQFASAGHGQARGATATAPDHPGHGLDFVRVLRHRLFVTPTAPVSSARSMFASLGTTPTEAGQRGANLGRWPPLVGAPWILPLWVESVLASIQPAGPPQLVSNEASNWCHYSRT